MLDQPWKYGNEFSTYLKEGLSRGKEGSEVLRYSLGLDGTEKDFLQSTGFRLVEPEAITDLISSGFIFEMAP